MTTERLYYTDSHLTEFDARVVEVVGRVSGWAAVKLDRTAFYPTGGGQPSDTGFLNDARVVECIDEEEEGVTHVIQGRAPAVGTLVKGRVDWERRLDHIQQHTGQHILSQAFVTLHGAETRGFRMMEKSSEVDVALDAPTDERIEAAIELANSIIWSDRPLRIHNLTPEEAAQLPLRKDSAREGTLRVIEIEGFDFSPCGGTHAQRTGEVGLIAVRSWERAKGMTRIEFVAGGRALADYRQANQTARQVAALFSAARDESPTHVRHLIEENKQLSKQIRQLEEASAQMEAASLLQNARVRKDGVKVVSQVFDGRDANQIKQLALALIAHTQTIALLGSRDGETARLIFARSEDVDSDMNALIRATCTMLDGRGGGRADIAQGGGRLIHKLSETIQTVTDDVMSTDEGSRHN